MSGAIEAITATVTTVVLASGSMSMIAACIAGGITATIMATEASSSGVTTGTTSEDAG